MAPTIPRGITTQNVGSTILGPWLKAPPLPAPPPSVSGLGGAIGRPPSILGPALLGVALIGVLGGDQFRDEQLAKLGKKYDPSTGLSTPINTGSGKVTQGVPPFTGGQSVGVLYNVIVRRGDYPGSYYSVSEIVAPNRLGPIRGIDENYPFYWVLNHGNTSVYEVGRKEHYAQAPKIISITRTDQQTDTGGNPSSIGGGAPILEGYSGSGGTQTQGREPRPTPPPSFKPNNVSNKVSNKVSNNVSNNVSSSINTGLGIGTLPDRRVVPPPMPTSTPSPTKTAPPGIRENEKRVPPPIIPGNDPPSINNQLFQIGSILGVISANTSPEAQRLNSKNGACDALNSPSCREGLKNDIKNPLEAKLNAAQIARDSNAAAQSAALTGITVEQQAQKGVLASILAKAGQIFDLVGKLFNNTIIDKAMQYITMITVIHNAAMLTRGIGDTLGSALDSGLQAFGLVIKDKDGNQQGVTQIIGKSFADLIKSIIGADNYTALTNTWLQANRVYQAGINLLSNVQSIIDSTSAVAELTSNRVATLMNSLRNAGVVRENAYGSQSENTTRFNAFMNKLEALEQGTSNLASITGNIVSVQQSVNELKANRQEFDNALKDKPVGSTVPENTAEKEAKKEKREESVFTIGNFSIVRPPEQT